MKTTLTEFLRSFREAREAADRGDSVIVKGENGDYVFERRAASLQGRVNHEDRRHRRHRPEPVPRKCA
jgi:hypothetical protein